MDGAARSAVRSTWRGRVPAVLVAVACVLGVVIAVTGASKPLPALQFLPAGHWVYNASAQRAYHVEGGGGGVDSQVPVPGDAGSQVVQDDQDGYVIGNGRMTRFGKSTLSVDGAQPLPTGEIPVGIETIGGPYLVYRQQGRIVRLGLQPVALSTGGSVTGPVAAADGTVWMYRPANGTLCKVTSGSNQVLCPAVAPQGHTGAITLVANHPMFIDTTASTAAAVTDGGLAAPVPLGVSVEPDTIPAPVDVDGKVALLQPGQHAMTFVAPGNASVAPVTAQVPPGGHYLGPESTGSAVALVDEKSHTMLTYGPDGRRLDTKPVQGPAGGSLHRGEDSNVYFDGADGAHVLIVGNTGSIADVPVVGGPAGRPGPGGPTPGKNPPPDNGPDSANAPNTPNAPNPEPGGQAPPDTAGPSPAGRSLPPDTGGTPDTVNRPGPQSSPPPRRQPPRKPPPGNAKPPAVPATPPGAPTGVTAAAGAGSVTVRWGAATANRAPITRYLVTVRPDGGRGRTVQVGGTARAATVGGLAAGGRYTATVAAVNSAGTGPAAASAPVTLASTAAAAPTVRARVSGTTGAVVSWTAPNLGGGKLVGYQVSATGQTPKTVGGTSTTYTGLTPGQTVTFAVSAITTGASGNRITGAAGRASVRIPQGNPTIRIAGGMCDGVPSCPVDVTMTGFAPNTRYQLVARDAEDGVDSDDLSDATVTTDAQGRAHTTAVQPDYDHDWIIVTCGLVVSNRIRW